MVYQNCSAIQIKLRTKSLYVTVLNDHSRGYHDEKDSLDHWRALNRLGRSDGAMPSSSINQ